MLQNWEMDSFNGHWDGPPPPVHFRVRGDTPCMHACTTIFAVMFHACLHDSQLHVLFLCAGIILARVCTLCSLPAYCVVSAWPCLVMQTTPSTRKRS